MKRFIPIFSLFLLLIPLRLVFGSDEVYPENTIPDEDSIQEVNLVLDGVELTLSTPFLPSQRIIVPDPGDPVQVANIVQKEPSFRSLTITAIPYGTKPSVEVLPIAEPDNLVAYQNALRSHRRFQGGKPVPGPTATLFGQAVTGIASTVYINIDVFEPKPVRIVEWVVEAGNRIWLLRISQEIQVMEYYLSDRGDWQISEDLAGINLLGTNLEAPSIRGDTHDFETTSITSATSISNLPFPPWWDGDCDKNTYYDQTGIWSYPLGGSYRAVKACGPRPWADGAPNAYTQFFAGSWGVLEWECVELSMRFMYLAYGIVPYKANGNQVVTNYSGTKLIKINNGTPGFAPQPNDIMSSGPETAVGHTTVVIASNVDPTGNGTITILEQNSSSTGIRTLTVTNWEVLSFYTVIGWLHDPSNSDYTPPTGDILEPLGNLTLGTTTIHLEGWASDDDSGLSSAQFIANYAGSWHDVGPGFSNILFSYDWDWCKDAVPDGPISLALRLTDNQGNQTTGTPGLRHLVKKYTCPSTPPCLPSANQVALFADLNFGGNCQILNIGSYPDSSFFNTVGDDQVESILVGQNVVANIFTETGYQGRRETLSANDANLSENRTRSNKLTSLIVLDRNSFPGVPSHQWPPNLSTYSESDSLTLLWNDEGGASLMRASIDGPSLTQTSSWGSGTTWSLGSLSPGVYSWRLQARNEYGDSAWSSWYFFIISEDSTSIPASTPAPFLDTMEGDTSAWISTGLWHRTNNDSHSSNNSWWYSQPISQTYNTNAINFGGLTTPPVTIPPVPDPYYLEFWSKYETEGPYSHWDQRRVQVSIDGSNFQDIYQLKDDPTGEWLKVNLDLSPYYAPGTTHNLQVRFYFSSVDAYHNDYLGWYIDDVQVSASAPQTCNDPHEDNDTPAGATGTAYGDMLSAEICPGIDRDFYSFTGTAGDHIVVDIDSKTTGSELDSLIQLLDHDGTSILAIHDDEVPGIRQDPHLGYRLPRDGTYFLQVMAWDAPMGTGSYSLTLFTDNVDPNLDSVTPTSGTFLPATEIDIRAVASDGLSGISHVQYLGFADGWDLIGEDWDGTDGWGIKFDTSGLTEGDQIDFYTRAYDWAGNWSGAAAWGLTLDFTYPDTSATPLPTPSQSTAIHLNWSATDNLAGIRSYNVRHRVNSEAWLNQGFDRDSREWWYIGNAGNSYTFRIRAIDNAGNLEPYLEGAEVSTTIPAISTLCSTPDAWDTSAASNDNSAASATPLPNSWQTHNFCNRLTTDRLFDVDWFRLNAESDLTYTIAAIPLHESTGVVIKLYDSDGTSILGESSAGKFGNTSTLFWTADQEKTVYIALSHLDGRVAGNAVAYQVAYEVSLNGTVLYFPLIYK
jgi:hypothetical protein